MKKKESFFERLTGSINVDEEEILEEVENAELEDSNANWMENEADDGELAVDVYQTPDEIVLKAMIAGVKPDDLDVSITRDMVTIKGTRHEENEVAGDDFYHRELYWGSFSRTILLPQEVEPEEAEAMEKHGLLVLHLPKVNRKKSTKIKIKST